MKQLLSHNGQSLWSNRPDGHQHERGWYTWNESLWYNKQKDATICEVVGYQLAEFLGIPVQPWIGYIETRADLVGRNRPYVSMLIEKWKKLHSTAAMVFPAKTHPELVGKALALSTFDRFEWAEWMLSEDLTELRILDLERIGVIPSWPPQRTRLRLFRQTSERAFRECHDAACSNGILAEFLTSVERALDLNFNTIINLTGHPSSNAITNVIVSALEKRQAELKWLIHQIPVPIRKTARPTKSRLPPRKGKTEFAYYNHPQFGKLEGWAKLSPDRRNTWCVRWSIGSLDDDTKLSSWFAQDMYDEQFRKILKDLWSAAPKIRVTSASVRWGTADRLEKDAAESLLKEITFLWRQILSHWSESQTKKTVKQGQHQAFEGFAINDAHYRLRLLFSSIESPTQQKK